MTAIFVTEAWQASHQAQENYETKADSSSPTNNSEWINRRRRSSDSTFLL